MLGSKDGDVDVWKKKRGGHERKQTGKTEAMEVVPSIFVDKTA
jgi:hypothetical protein